MVIFFSFLRFLWKEQCSKSERTVFNTEEVKISMERSEQDF